MLSLSVCLPISLFWLTLNQTVAGEHADSGGKKDGGEGPTKKKKKMAKGLFNVQWKVSLVHPQPIESRRSLMVAEGNLGRRP